MSIYSEIAEKIKQMGGNTSTILFLATVKEVKDAACTIMLEDLELTDVRLRSVLNSEDNKILITPKKDSTVLVADLSHGEMRELVIVQYSEVEKIEVCIGESTIEVSDGDITINGGKNDGLVKVAELTNKLNELVNAFNNHTHSGVITAVSGGSGDPAVGTPGNTGTPVNTAKTFTKDDYEDTKVTH